MGLPEIDLFGIDFWGKNRASVEINRRTTNGTEIKRRIAPLSERAREEQKTEANKRGMYYILDVYNSHETITARYQAI
jgi:inner membrane protein involved in colicin E2 resistance